MDRPCRQRNLELVCGNGRRLEGYHLEEIGYCNGNNRKLNAVECHRSSEIDIAVNDLIILFGRQQDIENGHSYDTSLCAMFCR